MKRLWASGKVRLGLGLAIGAAAGATYALTLGCRTGTCPLTGNPLIAAAFGAWLGSSLFSPRSKSST